MINTIHTHDRKSVATECQRSLVRLHIVSILLKLNKTHWTYSANKHCLSENHRREVMFTK